MLKDIHVYNLNNLKLNTRTIPATYFDFFYQTQIRKYNFRYADDTHTEKQIHIQKNRNFDKTNENPIRINGQ